jgi:uncharacterized membrane protein YphA (DoxX/SURF4 family)
MKKIITNKYFLLTMRILLSLTFIISGIEKISNPEEFAQSIENFRVLPFFSINIFALSLPWLEVLTGILLFFGVKVKENSFVITGMLMVFTLGIILAIFRNLDIDCGCFGTLHAQKVGLLKVIENLALIIFSILVFLYHPKNFISIEADNLK